VHWDVGSTRCLRVVRSSWYAQWNSASVGNGTYTLQSVGTEADGTSVTSAPIGITVSN
jgi:hypothetical protein